jgi:hypothetical protein
MDQQDCCFIIVSKVPLERNYFHKMIDSCKMSAHNPQPFEVSID